MTSYSRLIERNLFRCFVVLDIVIFSLFSTKFRLSPYLSEPRQQLVEHTSNFGVLLTTRIETACIPLSRTHISTLVRHQC